MSVTVSLWLTPLILVKLFCFLGMIELPIVHIFPVPSKLSCIKVESPYSANSLQQWNHFYTSVQVSSVGSLVLGNTVQVLFLALSTSIEAGDPSRSQRKITMFWIKKEENWNKVLYVIDGGPTGLAEWIIDGR